MLTEIIDSVYFYETYSLLYYNFILDYGLQILLHSFLVNEPLLQLALTYKFFSLAGVIFSHYVT